MKFASWLSSFARSSFLSGTRHGHVRRRRHDQPAIAAELLEERCLLAAPTAVDDTGAGFSTNEDSSFTTASVLANDSDGDGDSLSIVSVTGGAYGTVTANSDGTLSYMLTPNMLDYLGDGATVTDTVSYTIDDGNAGQATANVTITINGVNDAPNAENVFTKPRELILAV